MFDGRVLDQIELGVEEFKAMSEFPVSVFTIRHVSTLTTVSCRLLNLLLV